MRTNRPYVQLDPAVIEQARQMDLLSYLRAYDATQSLQELRIIQQKRNHSSGLIVENQ